MAVLVASPFLVAVPLAILHGWVPVGDEGTMTLVARQVFTHHPPLVGENTSSARFGVPAYHPGPMVYYVMAPFVALFGANGLLIGAALVASVSAVLIGYVSLRVLGREAALLAWVTALAMGVSVGGTAYLYRPFKTISAVLVVLLFLHLCVGIASGHWRLLPLWVLAASYPTAATAQFVVVIALTGAATVGLVARRRWRSTRAAPIAGGHPGLPAQASTRSRLARSLAMDWPQKRTLVVAGAVVVACWWGPILDAVLHSGGNLLDLRDASVVAARSGAGLSGAVADVARGLVFHPAVTSVAHDGSASAEVVAAGVLLAVCGVALWRSRRRMSSAHRHALVVVGTAIWGLAYSLTTRPADGGFEYIAVIAAAPVGAFTVSIVSTLLVATSARPNAGRTRVVGVALAGAVAVLAVAVGVPGPIQTRREDQPWAYRAVHDLGTLGAARLGGDGTWEITPIGDRNTLEVALGMQAFVRDRGVEIAVDLAPGLGAPEGGASGPSAGEVVVVPADLGRPGGDGWTQIASYEPRGRSARDAREVAAEVSAFARRSGTRVADDVAPRAAALLCVERQLGTSDCPAARRFRASGWSTSAVSDALVAMAFALHYDPQSNVPVLDGPRPPARLLEQVHRLWSDVPLDVYASPRDGGRLRPDPIATSPFP